MAAVLRVGAEAAGEPRLQLAGVRGDAPEVALLRQHPAGLQAMRRERREVTPERVAPAVVVDQGRNPSEGRRA
jgi:hypothetical protein